MTIIKSIKLSPSDQGKDPNDRRNDPTFLEEVAVLESAAEVLPDTEPPAWTTEVIPTNDNFDPSSYEVDEQTDLTYPIHWIGDIEPILDTSSLIDQVIKPESMNVSYGDANCGKTFITLDMDLCIASGRD